MLGTQNLGKPDLWPKGIYSFFSIYDKIGYYGQDS